MNLQCMTAYYDLFFEVFLRCLLRNRWIPSSINSFAEQSRSIASFLISLIRSSSRVVVNFFLSFIRWHRCIRRIFNSTIFAIYVPTCIRLAYYRYIRVSVFKFNRVYICMEMNCSLLEDYFISVFSQGLL